MKNITTILCFLAMSSFAKASCPDLSGTYFFVAGNNTITLTVKTKFENGKAIYDFERSNTTKPWVWQSIADGKAYAKTMNADYTNVEEVASCKNGVLHRSLKGDWINSDDLVPFDVESDMSLTSPDVLHWYSDFSGYGLRHVITDETYQRK